MRSVLASPRSAILLLGPTGSGKTPLGDHIERHGLAGRRCLHFDFGANLRQAAAGECGGLLDDQDLATVRRVLASGALLEENEFPVAKKLLRAFLAGARVGEHDLVILNGLPRHTGQARDIADILDVTLVVYLRCPVEVVRSRIRLNSGGDRTERVDDSPREVDNKLRIFEERTAPLLEYFRGKGVEVFDIEVTTDTEVADIADRLASVLKKDQGWFHGYQR